MDHEKFTPGMLRAAKVPDIADIAGRDIDAVKVRIKLFDLGSGWIWYVAAGSQKTGTCFGFVHRGGDAGDAIAYFQLRDLNEMQGLANVNIQRSIEWNPQTSLGEVIEERVR